MALSRRFLLKALAPLALLTGASSRSAEGKESRPHAQNHASMQYSGGQERANDAGEKIMINEDDAGIRSDLSSPHGTDFIGNDSNLLIVFYVQIMPDDFVMQLHR
ncbi:hypothetical protein RZR10_15360, partial [Enterobacter asburiae]